MFFLPLPPLGDPAETDYTAVGCAVTTISSNLTEMSRGVKLLAALLEDEGGSGRPLLQAAKGLAGAVSELLRSAQPASAEVRGFGVEIRVDSQEKGHS
jgi:talin